MPGAIVLDGGNSLSPESNSLYREIFRLTGQSQSYIVVVPVAAVDNPRKAVRGAVAFFKTLGFNAEHVMITDHDTAQAKGAAAPLEHTNVIYLTDGNPMHAVDSLRDTETLAALQRAWERGAVIAAEGAGAMILCDLYWDSGVWEKGLGLLKGIVVLPHFERLSGRFPTARLRKDLPAEYVLLGLDDVTGVVIEGQKVTVRGKDTVVVARGDSEQEYTDGDTFSLENALI
jgi:cyanophycinase